MTFVKTKLALTLAGVLAMSACSDDNNNGGDDKNTDPDPAPSSIQQDLVDNGQIQFTTDTGLSVDAETFAITTSIPFPGTPTSLPAGLSDEAYFGAVDPATTAGNAWWNDWTVHGSDIDGSLLADTIHPLTDNIGVDITPAAEPVCPGIATLLNGTASDTATIINDNSDTVEFPVCVISSDIMEDATLTNDYVWVLDGIIKVGDGDQEGDTSASYTLTIEEGTQIFGVEGTASGLRITRGSNIEAVGTADMPIIMAAVSYGDAGIGDVSDFGTRGEWGGLIVDGRAVHNGANAQNEVASEAAPDGETPYFGGTDDTDSSGTIQYVVIGESGFAFRPDQEVQGLTLEAVGSGTTIEYVQIFGSEDDGIEWFGGTVDMRYVVINGQDDDGLDMDEGFTGSVQNAIVRMGATNGDRGIESDNNSTFDATPRTAPKLANITLLGNVGKDDKTTLAALHREGFGGQVYRSVYTDDTAGGTAFEGGCLDVDDVAVDTLTYNDTIFNCSPDNIADADD